MLHGPLTSRPRASGVGGGPVVRHTRRGQRLVRDATVLPEPGGRSRWLRRRGAFLRRASTRGRSSGSRWWFAERPPAASDIPPVDAEFVLHCRFAWRRHDGVAVIRIVRGWPKAARWGGPASRERRRCQSAAQRPTHRGALAPFEAVIRRLDAGAVAPACACARRSEGLTLAGRAAATRSCTTRSALEWRRAVAGGRGRLAVSGAGSATVSLRLMPHVARRVLPAVHVWSAGHGPRRLAQPRSAHARKPSSASDVSTAAVRGRPGG